MMGSSSPQQSEQRAEIKGGFLQFGKAMIRDH